MSDNTKFFDETSHTIIWIDFKYIPYNIQNTKPVQYIKYIDKDKPDTFLVTIDLIAWGIKEIIVQIPQIYPNTSPIIGFMIFFLFLFIWIVHIIWH